MLARFKGDFDNYLKGTPKISDLKDGDRILLLESCTHHVSCDDIGRTKIPRWITGFTGKKLEYDVVAGLDSLSRPVTDYSLVIQCGGCMITRKQLHNRLQAAIKAGVPVTNYGMAIAYVQGIYDRAIAPFVKGKKSKYLSVIRQYPLYLSTPVKCTCLSPLPFVVFEMFFNLAQYGNKVRCAALLMVKLSNLQL